MRRYLIILLIIILISSLFLGGCSKPKEEEIPLVVHQPIDEENKEEEEAPQEVEPILEEEPLVVEEVIEEKEEVTEVEEPNPVVVIEPKPPVEKPPMEEPAKQAAVEEEPEEAVEGFAIKIEGKVSKPITLGLKQLKELVKLGYTNDYYSLNSFGTTGHTNFKGIKLWGLLTEVADIQDDAATVRIIATDGYEISLSISQVKREDYIDETDQSKMLPIIIAWQENGVDYDVNSRPPYKMVVGQKQPGDVNKPNWVSDIHRIIVE